MRNKKEVTMHNTEIQKNKRDYYKQLCAIKRQLERYGHILRKVQSPKTELGRNRKYKQTNHKY